MSDVKDTPAPPEPGVMGSLPKTRPQRASARRKPAAKTAQKPAVKTARKPAHRKPARRKPAKAEPKRAPRQGFEAESELELRKPVQPPGSTELAASVVELIGELAQSGLTGGGKLLKDALSRLSR
jgi:hypothetical protein